MTEGSGFHIALTVGEWGSAAPWYENRESEFARGFLPSDLSRQSAAGHFSHDAGQAGAIRDMRQLEMRKRRRPFLEN